jgi:hypothetical protein
MCWDEVGWDDPVISLEEAIQTFKNAPQMCQDILEMLELFAAEDWKAPEESEESDDE